MIFLLLKLCQLPHYRSHNSGKAQTRMTSWKNRLSFANYFKALASFIPPRLLLLRRSGEGEKEFVTMDHKLKLRGTCSIKETGRDRIRN